MKRKKNKQAIINNEPETIHEITEEISDDVLLDNLITSEETIEFKKETITEKFQLRDIMDGYAIVNVDGVSAKVKCDKKLDTSFIGQMIKVEYQHKDDQSKQLINGRIV